MMERKKLKEKKLNEKPKENNYIIIFIKLDIIIKTQHHPC
jgi:hypothetical protein